MKIDWKHSLTKGNESILGVMRIIDNESLRIACVVDDRMNLLGIVTDGDIRRAILAGKTLDSPVKDIMNSTPMVMGKDYDKKELLETLKAKSLIHMPIVEDGKLIELVTLEGLITPTKKSNPVFIMAGGFGTRLRPLTDNCPKPLLNVGDKPILETIIDQFIKCGFYNFYISTHYLPEMIRDYFGNGSKKGVDIKYVYESEPLGTGGALGLLPKEDIVEPLIMINGDILTNINFSELMRYHVTSKSLATMAIREYDIKVPYGVVKLEGDRIKSIVEKPVHSFFVNAGIYVINPELVKSVTKDQIIDMPTLLESQVEKDKKVGVFPIHEYWLDIGRVEEYRKAQIDIYSMDL